MVHRKSCRIEGMYKNALVFTILALFTLPLSCFSQEKQERNLKGQTKSRFDWQKLDSEDFLNYVLWKRKLEEKGEYDPIIDKRYKEILGKVLACVGKCYLSRGRGRSQLNFLSTLREGDEVQTGLDSYLWIYLMDGSLVRMAPRSAISLKEINISKDDIFVHVKLNRGLFYWRSKTDEHLAISRKKRNRSSFLST